MLRRIPARTLRGLFDDGEELAVVDVREELAFGDGHLFYAACLPLSRLELEAPAVLPRRSVRLVVCDAGEGLAERAAERLLAHGYGEVAVLAGGVNAWVDDGGELFSGIHVPSKAFGEVVEHACHTPSIAPEELARRMQAGEDLVVLDSRPYDEYHARSIPRGVCVPGAELVYRVQELAPSPDTLVVVNCAGRTRSIIGAQSLVEAGVPNRVVALRNGTMGWHLEGLAVASGARERGPQVSHEGLALARERAARVGARFGVRTIDGATLARFEAERERRTLYVFDVRQPEEYLAGHRPGSLPAPGGQLVQETERYAPVLGARVVLVDDTGVRATMTAAWLRRMGLDAYVLESGLAGEPESGPALTPVLGLDEALAETITAAELDALRAAGEARLLDLSRSSVYRAGHVPGAAWGLRARLHVALAKLAADGTVVLACEDGRLSTLAAAEASALDVRAVKVLAGGMRAWRAAGLALEAGATRLLDDPDDVWLRPYERADGQEQAMRDYLEWEVDLVTHLQRDGTARFALPPHKGAA